MNCLGTKIRCPSIPGAGVCSGVSEECRNYPDTLARGMSRDPLGKISKSTAIRGEFGGAGGGRSPDWRSWQFCVRGKPNLCVLSHPPSPKKFKFWESSGDSVDMPKRSDSSRIVCWQGKVRPAFMMDYGTICLCVERATTRQIVVSRDLSSLVER